MDPDEIDAAIAKALAEANTAQGGTSTGGGSVRGPVYTAEDLRDFGVPEGQINAYMRAAAQYADASRQAGGQFNFNSAAGQAASQAHQTMRGIEATIQTYAKRQPDVQPKYGTINDVPGWIMPPQAKTTTAEGFFDDYTGAQTKRTDYEVPPFVPIPGAPTPAASNTASQWDTWTDSAGLWRGNKVTGEKYLWKEGTPPPITYGGVPYQYRGGTTTTTYAPELGGSAEQTSTTPGKYAPAPGFEDVAALAKAEIQARIAASNRSGQGSPAEWARLAWEREKAAMDRAFDEKKQQDQIDQWLRQNEQAQENLASSLGNWWSSEARQGAEYAMLPGQQYFLGAEPGGLASKIAGRLGTNYDPNTYRPQAVKFDPQAAWNAARAAVKGG